MNNHPERLQYFTKSDKQALFPIHTAGIMPSRFLVLPCVYQTYYISLMRNVGEVLA